MTVKKFLSLPVMAVISLMAFVYYIMVFILIEDWVGLHSSPGIFNATFFTVSASFCLFSFLVSDLTDPGRVPSSYLPDVEGREITDHANGKDAICGLILFALTITLSTLLGWHIYLVLHNMTTIEYYEGKRAQWLARKSGQSYRHPFNIGAYKNITLVMLFLKSRCWRSQRINQLEFIWTGFSSIYGNQMVGLVHYAGSEK